MSIRYDIVWILRVGEVGGRWLTSSRVVGPDIGYCNEIEPGVTVETYEMIKLYLVHSINGDKND